jgi:DNA polymerase-3 subunit epsilon
VSPGALSAIDESSPLDSVPLVVFDTETTGLDPWDEGHRVVSLAMVHATLDGAETRDVLSAVVDPERSVPAAAAAVHGFTDAWLAEQRAKGELPRWAEIQPRVAAGMRGRLPMAYNLRFDAQMLRAALGRPRPPADYTPPGLDPRLWAAALWPGERQRLDDVCRRLGVELHDWHNALADTHAALAAARAMLPLLRAAGHPMDTVGDAYALQRRFAAEVEAAYTNRRARRGRPSRGSGRR